MSICKTFQGYGYLLLLVMMSNLAIASSASAQNNSQSAPQNIYYVNPQTGRDRPDQGSNVAPFKTISYAISRAKPEQMTIIQLADGNYSKATGEQFPIRLRPNVTLRGNEATKGKGVAILGGGTLLTSSRFTQNVAIAIADRAELRGVTVTNPNSRGYGLWIENASPAIANNTFLDNQQDGALITGQSTAIVSTNQFFRNGTSGLAIEGAASPDIRQNLFQQTTYGMSIRQESTPQVTENTFTQNQNGILIQASAKPILRGNAVINNRDYGLTISDTARPDLGKINDDGNNVFQGNGTFDIQNATRERVAAIGNQLDVKRVKGNLQLLNVRSPANLLMNSSANNIATSSINPPNIPAPNIPEKKSDRFATINQQLNQQLEQKIAVPNFNSLSPIASANSPNQTNSPFWYEPVSSIVVRITSKSLEAPAPNKLEITRDLPPVRAFPPSGEPVNQPIQIAPRENTSMTPQIPPRYRVVVPVDSPNAVAQVRQIVPNSFASRLNGYLVVQTGAYSDRRIAEVQVSRLAQQGLSARIEAINP